MHGDSKREKTCDASQMPYNSDSFDLVMSSLFLHEIGPSVRTAVLGEMKRVLNNDGRILVVDYHPGPIRRLKGLLTKAVILSAEVAAGRQHFRNYRHFIAAKGVPRLAEEHQLSVDKYKIVSGGSLGVYLLRPV